ncbi:4Fe-4S dicluster domain-containing protein [Mesobacillus persicus]|uniref:4Fe-4S dicluster domain-containing protein n=1 Tax=Mesobacillus persicus TaxID=930146 RepID=A0A1H7YVR3_9BACI|nr:4Fe-4S binding protein [Mesobacillus persicus]SEM49458.1 4Fe-4S dicluster domain-containing protein [Mesobacillus persicus]
MSLFINWLESLSYELEAADSCVRKTSPFSTCTVCIDSCEVQAITGAKGSLTIDHKLCTGCGRCVTVCPVQALMGESPKRKTLDGILLLDEGPLPTVNELLYLYKKGICTIYLPSEDELASKTRLIIEEANIQLTLMEKESFKITSSLTLSSAEKKLSRRDFFSKVTNDSKKYALASAAPAKWRFNQNHFNLAGMFPGWSFYSVGFETSCTLCETCFKLCPNGVFTLKDENLEVNSEKCSGCMLCVDVCMEKGMTISLEVTPSELQQKPVVKNECQTCGSNFPAWEGTDTCPICKKRKQLKFLF